MGLVGSNGEPVGEQENDAKIGFYEKAKFGVVSLATALSLFWLWMKNKSQPSLELEEFAKQINSVRGRYDALLKARDMLKRELNEKEEELSACADELHSVCKQQQAELKKWEKKLTASNTSGGGPNILSYKAQIKMARRGVTAPNKSFLWKWVLIIAFVVAFVMAYHYTEKSMSAIHVAPGTSFEFHQYIIITRWYLSLTCLCICLFILYEMRPSPNRYVPSQNDVKEVIGSNEEKQGERQQEANRHNFELAFQLFSGIREMIVNEDTLISNRVTWQIIIQGGLFASFITILQYYGHNSKGLIVLLVITFVGMVFSAVCFSGVRAAFQAVKVFKETLHIYQDVLLPEKRALPRSTGDRYVAKRGKFVGYFYALIPGILWLLTGLIALSSLGDYLHPIPMTEEKVTVTSPIVTEIKQLSKGHGLPPAKNTRP